MQPRVVVGEEATLQHLVRRETDARDDVGRREGGLLDLGGIVRRVAIELEHADGKTREIVARPDFRDVERIPAGAFFPLDRLGLGHHLDEDAPFREFASGDGVEEIALRVVGVGSGESHRVFGPQIPDPLLRLEVPFHPDRSLAA